MAKSPKSDLEPLLPDSHSHSSVHHPAQSDCPPLYTDLPSGSSLAVPAQPASHHFVPVSPSLPSKPSLEPPDFSAIDFGQEEPDGQARPPEFSVYRASYVADSIGNITSHDAHLNSDGEALCRFILLQISAPPGLFVKLSGSHEDVRIETTTETVDGRTEYRTREHRQTVTDFSFTMPIPSDQALEHGIKRLYVVSDGEVVGRGGHWRERGQWENGKDLRLLDQEERSSSLDGELPGRATASVGWKERRRADKIAKHIKDRGHPPFIPPWLFPDDTFPVVPSHPPHELMGPNWDRRRLQAFSSLVDQGYYLHQQPSPQDITNAERELRAWCDDYCNNKKRLKQFKVEKTVFGWDLRLLERELLELLHATPHLRSTHFTVDFHPTSSLIIVRPVDMFSKIFSLAGIYKFLLSILLIYPILWLLRYLVLGVEYDVVRVAYPLVYWEATDESGSSGGRRVLKGITERDWLAENRSKISRACQDSKIGYL